MNHIRNLLLAGLLRICTAGACILSQPSAAVTAADAPTVSASEHWAQPGETVTVEIAVAHNPGMAALSLNIAYDKQKLTLLDVKNLANWNGAEFLSGGDRSATPYTLNWDSDAAADYTADGVLAVLTFAVSANASGDAPIGVALNQESTFHADFSDAKLDTQNGVIHIGAVTTTAVTETTAVTTAAETQPPAPLRGDADSSGTVDVIDAQLALAAYAELMAGNPSGLSDTAFRAADVDLDGELSAPDAQYILLYYTENTIAMRPTAWEEIIR